LRHYALIVALGKHRSVTRVAEALGLSQPTVTHALADIEDIFKAVLFSRTGKGLEPTAIGELVMAHASHMLAENDALMREIDGVRAGYQGQLRIGILPYASSEVLDTLWRYLFSLQPRMTAVVLEDVTGVLLASLRGRTLDCAICRFSHDTTDNDDLYQKLLYQQTPRLVIAKPSAAAFKRQAEIDVARLHEMDWIFPPSATPIRGVIDAIFASAGMCVPTPLLEAHAVRTLSFALRHMPRGITLLPDDIAQAVTLSGNAEVLPHELPWRLPPVGFAWRKNSPRTHAIGRLRNALFKGCTLHTP